MAAMRFTCFCFLSLQPKGFRRYYSSPLLIHEQFGCIKEVMPIGRFWLLFRSVSLWQCSATAAADFQPWYLPSAPFSDWMSFCHLRKGPLQRYKAGRGEGVFIVFHSKPPTCNLLVVILFIITTTWAQSTDKELRKKLWITEVKVGAGKSYMRDKDHNSGCI